jgi:quercetin dioxygenase-like cupin family protein
MDDEFLRREDAEAITEQERRAVVILAEREDVAITWSRYAAGERGPDLHVHREHTDAFYVLEGELTFLLGPDGTPIVLPAGGFAAVPPNVVHSFANEGSADACWLNMHAPAMRFGAYLRALRDGQDAVFDSFDPPGDGGLPAAGAIVAGPGEGERPASGDHDVLLKVALPELCVAEWSAERPAEPGAYYALEPGRVLGIHAPDGGLAARLRDASG